MPKVQFNELTMNYDQQGTGEPLILIPYLAADYACYAFQVADYEKHFTCISVDLRGAGETDKPEGTYSTELFADDVAAFMQALGIPQAHVAGLALGAATGMRLAARYPEMVIQGVFPWCFTPELYASRPDYIGALSDFVRGRPVQPLDAFMRQSNAVIAHDAEAHLGQIKAPVQITFGRYDMVTSTRFADPLRQNIQHAELVIFEECAHAPIYEKVDEFNQATLEFLKRHSG